VEKTAWVHVNFRVGVARWEVVLDRVVVVVQVVVVVVVQVVQGRLVLVVVVDHQVAAQE
jgi:hypothetical protein